MLAESLTKERQSEGIETGALRKVVEARGVEPLSEQPSTVASTCLAGLLISVEGFERQNPLHLDPC